LPQTHPGPLRTADWQELAVGTYDSENWAAAPTPALKDLLHEYELGMEHARSNAKCAANKNCLTDGKGFMIIEDWQQNLKRITFRVVWGPGLNNAEPCVLGAQNEF